MIFYFIGMLVTFLAHFITLLYLAHRDRTFINFEGWYEIFPYILLWPYYWYTVIKVNFFDGDSCGQ
jgi:hypothetical protein